MKKLSIFLIFVVSVFAGSENSASIADMKEALYKLIEENKNSKIIDESIKDIIKKQEVQVHNNQKKIDAIEVSLAKEIQGTDESVNVEHARQIRAYIAKKQKEKK